METGSAVLLGIEFFSSKGFWFILYLRIDLCWIWNFWYQGICEWLVELSLIGMEQKWCSDPVWTVFCVVQCYCCCCWNYCCLILFNCVRCCFNYVVDLCRSCLLSLNVVDLLFVSFMLFSFLSMSSMLLILFYVMFMLSVVWVSWTWIIIFDWNYLFSSNR